MKAEAKGRPVQHKQDVPPDLAERSIISHTSIHLLPGCNEMHPGHLEEMHTPAPTTAGTPNERTVFILHLQRCNGGKMMVVKVQLFCFQLTISYVETLSLTEARQRQLEDQYCFTCRCQRCHSQDKVRNSPQRTH